MLPVPYFHITVTVPAELRDVLRTHQRDGYAVLMQANAEAPLPPARVAARLPQGSLFRPVAPVQRRNAARVRQMLQLQVPPKVDPPQDPVAATLEPPSADPTLPAEPLICPHSALSPRAADLHPHAHVKAGNGTMIRSPPAAIVRSCCRVPRHAVEIRCHQRTHRPHLGQYDAADYLASTASNRNSMAAFLRPHRLKPDH
jgi:hypothetical protein